MATKIKNPMMQRMMKATSTADAAILSESELFNNKDIIQLDIPIINLAFSGDLDSGLTNGLTILAGKSRNFKCLSFSTPLTVYTVGMKKIETTYGEFYKMVLDNPSSNYYVKTHTDDYTKVNAVVEKAANMLLIKFDNGVSFECADTHAFMDKNGDSIVADELKIHSRVLTKFGTAVVTSIKKSKLTTAYDISIASPHWYVNDDAGFIHHNTMLGLYCVKAYLDKYDDAICIFFDNEGGSTPETLKTIGIDGDRVLHIPVENLEQLKFDFVKQLTEIKRGDHVIFIVDSFSNIASIKELDDANDGKSSSDLTKAKILKSVTRMITPMLLKRNIPCIGIAHTYDTMEVYSKQVISGGLGIVFNANSIFIISKAQEKDSDGDLSGWNFTLNVEKSRYVREKSKFPFTVLYESGIQKYSGLLDIALELGRVIKPNNGWYSRVDDDGVVEDKKWRAKDTGCSDFWDVLLNSDSFKKLVRERYKLSNHSESKDDPTMTDAIDDLED